MIGNDSAVLMMATPAAQARYWSWLSMETRSMLASLTATTVSTPSTLSRRLNQVAAATSPPPHRAIVHTGDWPPPAIDVAPDARDELPPIAAPIRIRWSNRIIRVLDGHRRYRVTSRSPVARAPVSLIDRRQAGQRLARR